MGLAACMFSTAVLAEPEEGGLDYAPLFSSKSAQPLKLTECRIDAVANSGFVMNTDQPTIAHCGGHDVSVTGMSKARKRGEEDAETTHVVISIKGAQQKAVQAILRLDDFPAEFIDAVNTADLNGDSKPDFILDLSSHGNGLAAEIGGKLFLLSDAHGYRYLSLKKVMSGSRLVRWENAPAVTLLLQRLATQPNGSNSVRGSDGKSHTFFVFDLLKFDVSAVQGVRIVNSLDTSFPFWTLFTDEPTHTGTSLLTPARKKILWHDPLLHAVSGRLIGH
jgi:hypothetical protein